MSDMTSLSNEYTANADFAKQFNSAVLELKRCQFGVPSAGEDEIPSREHRNFVAVVLRLLARQFGEASVEVEDRIAIPADVLERLHTNHRSEMDWFLQDLNGTAQALTGDGILEQGQWDVIDEICDIADAAASATFRRLWRR